LPKLLNSPAIAADTASPAGAITPVVKGAAAAFAALTLEPIATRSEAAEGGAAAMKDIRDA
jgi:hypothetical protein